jgi:hypothetical protein
VHGESENGTNNHRSSLSVFRWTIILTCIFEALTLVLRFGAGLRSTVDTEPYLSHWTFGYRIHHGYVGAVLVLISWLLTRLGVIHTRSTWNRLLLICGWALIASDLIHHFAVLWPLTGSPEFDLVYPS